jgi:hypothetical protein
VSCQRSIRHINLLIVFDNFFCKLHYAYFPARTAPA